MFERYTEKARRVIFFARYEASQFGSPCIETEHLLLGLLREEKSFAAELLKERGLELKKVREDLARVLAEGPGPGLGGAMPVEFSRDLTQAAIDGELTAAVGRSEELEGVIEVLGYRRRANPLLIGERGAGKAAIVEALAQRIADGTVPPLLAERRITRIVPRRWKKQS